MSSSALTLFAGRTDPDQVLAELRRLAPDADIQGDGTTWRRAIVRKGGFLRRKTVTFNHDPGYYAGPGWPTQKSGMRGFINTFPDMHRQPRAHELINGLEFALGVVLEPELERNDDRFKLAQQLARSLGAVIFLDNAFLDAEGNRLISAGGPDPDATWPAFCKPLERPQPPDAADVERFLSGLSGEARERKQRSEALLQQMGVPFNSFLGAIADESQMQRWTTDEVVQRMLGVLAAALHGEGIGHKKVLDFIADKGIASFLTAEEAAFVAQGEPSQQDRMKFGWRYEAVWVLLWYLGYVDSLDPPDHICEVARMGPIIRDRGVADLVRDANPRAPSDLLDQADLSLRFHWAAVDARVNGNYLPPQFDPGVIFERHYVFNWLVSPENADWDRVETNT